MGDERKERKRDADKTRETILKAAAEVFASKGCAGARVEDIAKATGYSNSLIVHHYFSSKEAVYKAVVRCIKEQGSERLAAILNPAANDATPLTAEQVQAFIEAGVRHSFDSVQANPQLRRILAWEIAGGWETFKQLQFQPEDLQWAAKGSAFIRRAQAAGFIRPEIDPTLLIANVLGISVIYLLSIPRYEVLFPGTDLNSSEALTHAREQIVSLIVHGTMTHPKENPGETEL